MQAVATDRKTVETQDSQAGAEPRSNASAPARQRHVETARQRAIAREPKPRTPASARPDSGAMLLVVLIRHGESQANATGADVLDPALTDVGAAQADAWRSRASTWPRLDAVLVSPLYRCVATAARALGACEAAAWECCPAAREHWWMCQQNRGRYAAELLPDLVSLPPHGLSAEAIEAAVGAPSEHWRPDEEATASKRQLGKRAALATLALVHDLCRRADAGAEKRVAVVCHWGVIQALTDVDAENCDVIALLFSPAAGVVDQRWGPQRRAAAERGWAWEVLGPFAARDAARIPLLEVTK
mmetsp:Transcript_27859/g.83591  ORF Transcript_27859/g.83591 Transcript_27859/m.83591 type:complete len:301 (-) Transcript_27859:59-961(-)